jgi:hypothetical protein
MIEKESVQAFYMEESTHLIQTLKGLESGFLTELKSWLSSGSSAISGIEIIAAKYENQIKTVISETKESLNRHVYLSTFIKLKIKSQYYRIYLNIKLANKGFDLRFLSIELGSVSFFLV